mgnify:CR=1 FL=1
MRFGHFLRRLLPVLLLVAGWGVVSAAAQESGASLVEQYLLAAANQDRAARGLGMLHRDPELARAAEGHAREMAAHGTVSHQFAGEAALTARVARVGVAFSEVSENVAESPNAVRIHALWMQSPGHRANLLDPAIDAAGISVVERRGEYYAVEDFAKTLRVKSLSQQESEVGSLIERRAGLRLDEGTATVAAARQTCKMSTGYAGSRKPWFVMRFTSDSLGVLPEELKTRLASGRYHEAAVGACSRYEGGFTSYNIAVMLYP